MAKRSEIVSSGIGTGAVMAAVISWSVHHSFWWMWLHAICGWLYIIAYGLEFVTQYGS